ncbi:MAG: FAD binding domain-containing protein, partial [Bacillota bacterium]
MGNKVFQPSTLKAAIEILNKKTDVEILAGGTDFILELDKIKDANKKIMDISKINELKYIKEDENVLRIGALTTFSELAKSEKIKKYIPALATAGKKVGSVQIRNRATIGGNIANASPAADSMPVLRSLVAKLKISSQKQNRIIPVQDIVKSFYKNNLRENEIIEEIII